MLAALSSQTEPKWQLSVGDRVDHFRILRLLGRGGMGQVYAARDEQLGRRVALKLVVASAGEDALDEARTTAQFSHPNIVTIYAVGTHKGLPYLALEYLEGETLRERLRSGPLSVQEALRLGRDVAEALRQAHRHQIQHRDLHPRNVFLGSDGRLRVLDFGLSALGASRADDGQVHIRGTPGYMAPEQWRGEPLEASVDIWGLGLLLYEALTGLHPYLTEGLRLDEIRALVLSGRSISPPSRSNEGVPEIVDALVMDCLAMQKHERPSAAEVAAQLSGMLSLSFSLTEREPSPFKGLRAFTEQDAGRFYGREREVAACVERLRKTSFITIIGASGAGKSSFVQAGVVPRIRESGALAVVTVRPGRAPLEALASELARFDAGPLSGTTVSLENSALDAAASEVESVPETVALQLLQNPSLLGLHLQQLSERLDTQVLLFVDQLEEVVTLTHARAERQAFVQAISLAAEDPAVRVRTIVTLREEFLSRVEAAMGPRGAITQITVLRNPDQADLRRVLLQPVADAQHQFDDESVVDEMVREASRSLACLPLLQFGGAKLWEGRDRNQQLLRRSTYAEMGGLAGALAQHADQVLEALTAHDLAIGRALCLRLVTPQRTRRAVPRHELLEGLGDVGAKLLDQFIQARLIVGRRGGEDADEELELVHESLIETWSRLAGWLAQSSEEMILVGELERASALWERRGRRDSDLWRGDALLDAQRTLRTFIGEIPPRVQTFLKVSQAREQRRQWRTRAAFASLVVVLALAAIGFARGQMAAERQRERAEAVRAQVEQEGARASHQRGQVVEAKAKLRHSLETRDSLRGRWLWRALVAETRAWNFDLKTVVFDVRHDPQGRYVALAGGRSALLYNAETGDYHRVLSAREILARIAFSPAGSWLAGVTRWSRVPEVWSLADGGPSRLFEVRPPPSRRPAWAKTVVDWRSEDELMVLKGAWLYVWNVKSGLVTQAEDLGDGDGAAFSVVPHSAVSDAGLHARSDGQRVLFGGLDVPPKTLHVESSSISALALNPHRQRVAVGLKSGGIEVWDYQSARRLWRVPGHIRRVEELRFDPTGDRLVSEADDGVRLWSIGTAVPIKTIECAERASGADLDRDGEHLVISCREGFVQRLALNVPSIDEVVTGHASETTLPSFSPDGKLVVSGSLDRSARVWDVEAGRSRLEPIIHPSGVFFTVFDSAGRYFATGQQNGTLQLIDPHSGRRQASIPAHSRSVGEMTLSADGRAIVTTSLDRTVRHWSWTTEEQLQRIDAGCQIQGVAVSADEWTAVTCYTDGRLLLFDRHGRRRRVIQRRSDNNPMVRWTKNGELMFGPDLGEVALWSPSNGVKTVIRRPGTDIVGFHSPTGVVALSFEGGALELTTLDRPQSTVRLTGSPVFTSYAAFDSTGTRVVTTGWDGAVRLWDATTGRPIWRTQAFLSDDRLVYGHFGWLRLDEVPVKPVVPSLSPALISAIEEPGARAVGARGSVCVLNRAGTLSWFDSTADRRPTQWTDVRPVEILPVQDGCVIREPQRARHFKSSGDIDVWVEDESVSAIAAAPDGVWISVANRLRRLAGTASEVTATATATALAPIGPWLAVGYDSGQIELIHRNGKGERRELRLENPLLASVARLAGGPGNTLVAGYLNGAIRVWDTASGALLLAGIPQRLDRPPSRLAARIDRHNRRRRVRSMEP